MLSQYQSTMKSVDTNSHLKLVREHMDDKTKLVSLVDPLNPLGSSYTKEELKDFADIAADNDIYLLHDITYRDFARDHHLMAKYAPEHTITVYSFSKIYGMAGMRIGAVIGVPDVIKSIKSIVINDLGTNVISQRGAIAALKSKKEWLGHIKNTTQIQSGYNQRRLLTKLKVHSYQSSRLMGT